MLSTIIFSKDRPLQLQAYLESLLYYSEIQKNYIHILYSETGLITYEPLISQYTDINWRQEKTFYTDLSDIIHEAQDYILWGCDDVFFKSSFKTNTCIKALSQNDEILSFSLRLGRNIQPNPSNNLIEQDNYLVWDWTQADLPHPLYPQEVWDWGYPWEVSGSIYRKSDIIDFLQLIDKPKNPNYLEGDLANVFRYNKALQKRKYLACFSLSKCLTLTVNRVQHTHPNAFDAAKDTSPRQLYRDFSEGYKLNWSKFTECINSVIQVGSEYFAIELNKEIETKTTANPSPLVSIICRVYNREQYIEETIISALSQTFKDFELLILDDGSTDNTRTIVEKYLCDSRVKYVYQENIGSDLNGFDELTNRCVALTSGELIAILDSDDICLPNRLERQIAEFNADPDIDVVFSDAYQIDAAGNILSTAFRLTEDLVFNDLNLLRVLYKRNIIPNPTVTIKRSAIKLMGGFENGFAPDYHFWLKSAPYIKFKYIDEKLVKYRIHDNSSSTGIDSHRRVFQESVKILWEIRNKFSIFDIYPEIYGCCSRQKALYSAYLDFANIMLTTNIPIPHMAIQEYQNALKHNGQGIEALNNLAIAFWAVEDRQNCFHIFNHLKHNAYYLDIVRHNIDLTEKLQIGGDTTDNFILLTETVETSELFKVIETLTNKLSITNSLVNLKELNLVLFPDWFAPEESLSSELEEVIKALTIHPDKNDISLLIESSQIAEEDANLLLSSSIMNLFMQEEIKLETGLEISLLNSLNATQWEALLPNINARIALKYEDREAIANCKATNLPLIHLNEN